MTNKSFVTNSKKKISIACLVLFAPAMVACSSTESAQCTRFVFQQYGGSSFSNALPPCPGSRVYSYDPSLFEHQASWVESYTKSADSSEKKSGKDSS